MCDPTIIKYPDNKQNTQIFKIGHFAKMANGS